MRILGVIASSIMKKITDTFNRTNTTTGLGTTSSGAVWSATRGNWFIDTNQAKSTDAATGYPIATVDAGTTDPTVLLGVSQGTGIAFWVSDNQNWWGVHPWQDTSYSQSCASYFSNCTSASYYQFCNSPSYGQQCNNVSSGYFTYCSSFGYSYACNSYGYIAGYATGQYSVVCKSYSSQLVCTASGTGFYSFCSGGYSTTYSCSGFGQGASCTGYGQACGSYSQSAAGSTNYLRLIKSVTNVVTTVVDQAVSATIASIKLIISNGSVTAKAYSDAGQVTQTGTDLTNTPVSPTTSTKHGLVLAPGGYTQGTIADNLTISM